jgi:CheY-like chemotaxis protein
MSGIAEAEVIRRTRFLVVDGDKDALSSIERYLQACGAPQVASAPAPLAGLRVLQEPRANFDCVICAHKRGTITGLQFLQGLRAGRWGGGKIQNVKFILMMGQLDVEAVQMCDRSGISGYFIGDVKQTAFAGEFIKEVIKALTSTSMVSPLPTIKLAHVNVSGGDFVLVPFDTGFVQAGLAAQQGVMNQLTALMQEQQLGGAVTPVWETPGRGLGYFAPPQHHARLASLTLDFVQGNLNREISVLRPPSFAVLASPGSAAYTAYMAAEQKVAPTPDDVLDLKGFEVPPPSGRKP